MGTIGSAYVVRASIACDHAFWTRPGGQEDDGLASNAARDQASGSTPPIAASPASELGSMTTNGGVSAKFAHIANRTATLAGNYKTFAIMLLVVLVWAISGPLFKFSQTWQLVINTGTTIITFLMVFLIQNTQNRDSLAMHLKLDEIIRVLDAADDRLMRAEDETDEELIELKTRYQQLEQEAKRLKSSLDKGRDPSS
jgi:low affinity Fe/Cu permease